MEINSKNLNPFFNKLMDETYLELSSVNPQNSRESLQDYFDKKNESFKSKENSYYDGYLANHSSRDFLLIGLDEIGVFRIIFEGVELDFPKNWSVFGKISRGSDEIITVGKESDPDLLIEVLSELHGPIGTIVFSENNDQVKMYFFEQDERFVQRDLEKIKENIKNDFKKAA